jgi:hypothetical protein
VNADRSPPSPLRAATPDACREVALAFIAGVASGWGKADLAAWLAGPYRAVARRASRPAGHRSEPPFAVAQDKLETVMRDARWAALAALERASVAKGRTLLVERAATRGHLVAVRHPSGRKQWMPVDAPGMRLVDRVLSLLAADCIARPDDYASLLVVCPRCEAVWFNRRAKQSGGCPGGH